MALGATTECSSAPQELLSLANSAGEITNTVQEVAGCHREPDGTIAEAVSVQLFTTG